MRYRSAWIVAATTVTAVGVWWAVAGWSLSGAMLTFTVTAALGAAVTAGSREPTWRRITSVSMAVGTTAVAVRGLLELLGGQAAVVVLLALVTASPPVARWLRRRLARRTRPVPHRSTIPSMTDLELCQAWSSSYSALQTAPTAATRAHIVTTRQAYLEELERRHPLALKRWLSTEAQAAGNPSRFLA